MGIVTNQGTDRVVDLIRPLLRPGHRLDLMSPGFSLFAYAELRTGLKDLAQCRLVLPAPGADLAFLGGPTDRGMRNKLTARWLASNAAAWLESKSTVHQALGPVPQGSMVLRTPDDTPQLALLGAGFDSQGLGTAPGNPLSAIMAVEGPDVAKDLAAFFEGQWSVLARGGGDSTAGLVEALRALAGPQAPATIYHLILQRLFGERGEDLDEEKVVNSATGIRDTVVWKKLYKFQRDGVVAAIDKLNRFGGCIVADSVGLGKTFEALAVIKYLRAA